MRNMGPFRSRSATNVGAITDHDYYQSKRADEHDQKYNGKDQYLLNAGIE
jgi:hypothetical protein